MSVTRCPTCQGLRPANASYCPQCGTAFDIALARIPDPSPKREPVDFSVRAGVKLGAGFVIGATLVTVVISVTVLLLLAFGLSPQGR